MSKKERRNGERYENQPEQEQQNTAGDAPRQEGDSLSALKAILSKVAALLKPLQLTAEEATGLVEDLYSSVLARDLQLAGEADDARKSSVLAYLEHTKIARQEGRIVIEFPSSDGSPALQEEPVSPATPPADREASKPAAPSNETPAE